MRAITVTDREAGVQGLTLTEIPRPRPSENDVVVEVHAAGFTTGELEWPGTWTDRNGHDRTPSVPGHEVAGVSAGVLTPVIGAVRPLEEAPEAFTTRVAGRTIISVRP